VQKRATAFNIQDSAESLPEPCKNPVPSRTKSSFEPRPYSNPIPIQTQSLFESNPYSNPIPIRIQSLFESNPYSNPIPIYPNKWGPYQDPTQSTGHARENPTHNSRVLPGSPATAECSYTHSPIESSGEPNPDSIIPYLDSSPGYNRRPNFNPTHRVVKEPCRLLKRNPN